MSATTVGANSALDQNADARTNANGAEASQTANNNSAAPLPSNRQKDIDRMQKERAKKQAALQKKAKKKRKDDADQDAAPAAASGTPAVSTARLLATSCLHRARRPRPRKHRTCRARQRLLRHPLLNSERIRR